METDLAKRLVPRKMIDFLKEYIETTDNHDKIGDFRRWLIDGGKMDFYGYHLPGKWFDVGIPETLNLARDFYNSLEN